MRLFNFLLSLVLHPYRRLYLTPRGWIFCAITVGMGLVALNTGHNLFHLIFGFLLSAVLVSGILSELVVRSLAVKRELPREVTARVPFPVMLELKNVRRRTIYAVAVSDSGDFFARRKVGYVAHLEPGRTEQLAYFAQVEKRGAYRLGSVRLSTRFPFGLFEKVRLIPLEHEFVAQPGYCEVPTLHSLMRGEDRRAARKQRSGEEVLSLRPALAEDDHRLIHWPTSARAGQLMVKEFAEPQQIARAIFFDNRGQDGERFEHAVEVAANLLRRLAGAGVPVSFSTWDEHFKPAQNGAQIGPALRHLALVAPGQTARQKGFYAWCQQTARGEGGIFLQAELAPPLALPRCEIIRL